MKIPCLIKHKWEFQFNIGMSEQLKCSRCGKIKRRRLLIGGYQPIKNGLESKAPPAIKSELDEIEEGDIILVKNNHILNQNYVECFVEKKVEGKNIFKLVYKTVLIGKTIEEYVNFDTNPVVEFVSILEKKKSWVNNEN